MILDEPIKFRSAWHHEFLRLMIQRPTRVGDYFIISAITFAWALSGSHWSLRLTKGRPRRIHQDDFDRRASEDYIVLKTSDRDQAANLIQDKLHI